MKNGCGRREKHKCGLIFKNKEELIQAMITLIEDKSLRTEMGKNGYHALENYYNLKYFQDNLLNLYNNLKCNFDFKI